MNGGLGREGFFRDSVGGMSYADGGGIVPHSPSSCGMGMVAIVTVCMTLGLATA